MTGEPRRSGHSERVHRGSAQGVLQKMHQKRIIHKLRSLSLEHAVVIRAISHGSGLLSNGVLSPKRISGETEIPEKRVREILAELKAMKEPI
jgi:hypothetical protein